VYLIGDLTVRSLTAFAQLGLGDGRVNQIGGYLGGGFTFTAPFSSRAQDALGLAVAAARNGSHYERAQTAAGGPAAGETCVDLTYLAQLVADRAARRAIRDPSGGHTRDAECRGAGAARRGITLNLGTGH